MKNKKKLFAATEYWNDNSGKKAVSSEWENWKTKWETIKTDYEKISLSSGADATKMNYVWYSKTEIAKNYSAEV